MVWAPIWGVTLSLGKRPLNEEESNARSEARTRRREDSSSGRFVVVVVVVKCVRLPQQNLPTIMLRLINMHVLSEYHHIKRCLCVHYILPNMLVKS